MRLEVDCDVNTPGVQHVCTPTGATHDVDIVFYTPVATSLGAFNFRLNSSNGVMLSPPLIADPDPSLNSNPDFNNSLAGSWDCNPPSPDNDTGAVSLPAIQSFVSCFGGNHAVAANSHTILATVHYNVIGGGTSFFDLSQVNVFNAGVFEIASCNPVNTASTDCYGAAASFLLVNSTADPGDGTCTSAAPGCTLREAINTANGTPEADVIPFAIAPGGPQTITLASALPNITTPVYLDASTQAQYDEPSPGTHPYNRPMITIDGNGGFAGLNFLGQTAGGVRALAFSDFTTAIALNSSDNIEVTDNYVGLDSTGMTDHGGTRAIYVTNGDFNEIVGNVISGSSTSGAEVLNGAFTVIRENRVGTDRYGLRAIGNGYGVRVTGTSSNTVIIDNQISGNAFDGLFLDSTGSPGAQISLNLVGTDRSGTALLTNGTGVGYAVRVNASDVLISKNVIAGMDSFSLGGLAISGNDNDVFENHIGTDEFDRIPLGNAGPGIYVSGSNNDLGGSAVADGYNPNRILSSAGAGIGLASGINNEIWGNELFSSGGIAIDLGNNNVSVNDVGDGDVGPNNLQNWPVITGVSQSAPKVSINATLDAPAGTYRVDVYASQSCDPSGNGEGRSWVDSASVSPGAFNITTPGDFLSIALKSGRAIALTATDSAGNTSEMSNCVLMAACAADDDCDGWGNAIPTLHLGPTNTNFANDNCPAPTWNRIQANTDGNFVDNPSPYVIDDKTWIDSDATGDLCDTDRDNDGLTDAVELSGPPCASASARTSIVLWDHDGDRFIDSVECTLGTDPANPENSPGSNPSSLPACGAAGDSDGDHILNRVEYCAYGSNPASLDSDGDMALDGARDGCEVASLNSDRTVNSGDQLLLAQENIRVLNGGIPIANFDLNKDGNINSGDQLFVAFMISPPGQCP